MSHLPHRWRVYGALLLASALWGSLYAAAKPAVAATGPFQVTLCRVTLAFLVLAPPVLARQGPSVLVDLFRKHWRGITLLGLLNFALSQVLALSALDFLPASVVGLLNNTHPLWVALGTAALFRPRRPLVLLGGSLVALAGVALVFLPGLALESFSGAGVVLALVGSGIIALGTVIGRRVMPGNDPVAVSALAAGVAIVPMVVLTMTRGGVQPIVDASSTTKMLLGYVGIGCTATNFVLWYYGLKYLSAAAASAFQYLIPPIGVGLAAVFLGEPLSSTLLLGTLCIVIGLVATQVASMPHLRWRSAPPSRR